MDRLRQGVRGACRETAVKDIQVITISALTIGILPVPVIKHMVQKFVVYSGPDIFKDFYLPEFGSCVFALMLISSFSCSRSPLLTPWPPATFRRSYTFLLDCP